MTMPIESPEQLEKLNELNRLLDMLAANGGGESGGAACFLAGWCAAQPDRYLAALALFIGWDRLYERPYALFSELLKELRDYFPLPEFAGPVTLYRGEPDWAETPGLGWTTELKVARSFGTRIIQTVADLEQIAFVVNASWHAAMPHECEVVLIEPPTEWELVPTTPEEHCEALIETAHQLNKALK